MQTVIDAVERIRSLPYAQIGCNYGQGREALLRHLDAFHKRRGWTFPPNANNAINDWIATSEKQMEILTEWLLPHQLPADYLYFLKYYGGIDIASEPDGIEFFSIFGFFPPALYKLSDNELVAFYSHDELTDALNDSDVIAYNFPSGVKRDYLYVGIWQDLHPLTDEEYLRIPINPATGKRYALFEDGYPTFRTPAVKFFLDLAGGMQQNAILACTDGRDKPMQKIADSFVKWLDSVADIGADFSVLALRLVT